MGIKATSIQTKLSVKECGVIFENGARSAQGAGSKMKGLIWTMGGGKNMNLYSPQDSPFSALHERPSFSVGVRIPRYQGGGGGKMTDIQMHVYDRGGWRDVHLVSEHKLMLSSLSAGSPKHSRGGSASGDRPSVGVTSRAEA